MFGERILGWRWGMVGLYMGIMEKKMETTTVYWGLGLGQASVRGGLGPGMSLIGFIGLRV